MNIRTTSLTCAAVCLMTMATPLAALAQYAPPTPQYAPPPQAAQEYAPPQQPAQIVTNGPQTNPGDVSPNWSARRNVIESAHYDQLLETNTGFREARMRKECGPVTDPQLHADCLASFGQDEPSRGFRR
jgi:murein L,D-transpeptidase YcbB/YkuD